VSKEKKPVVIEHLRLDHTSARASDARRKQMAARLESESGLTISLAEAFEATGVLNDSDQQRRIKAINAYLGCGENTLAVAKLRGSPMALLIEKASAKGEELMAAQEIERAWFALTGALMLRPLSMERVAGGRRPDWNAATAHAVKQYQAWAKHWSIRRKSHLDHTMECVIAAVIDQRPIRIIAEDLGFQHKRIERAVLGGLRDYAARAGWVDKKIAQNWINAAEQTFNRRAVA
jgi:hypothetical protein